MVGRYRRGVSGSSISEFGPSMWLFFMFILIPLLDLMSFGTGVGTASLMSTMGARQTAGAASFTDAKASVAATEQQLKQFTRFCVMQPSGGATNGLTLRVLVIPVQGGAGQKYTNPGGIPNSPPTDPANPSVPAMNTTNCVYQYEVTCAYDIMPLLNFSGTPFLKDVPALGKAVPVVFVSTASVEHPEGLNQ